MKIKKFILGMFLFVSSFSFGQYEQYIDMIQPYLRDSTRSGFMYFNMPNAFQPGSLYNLYKQYANDYDYDMVLKENHTDSLVGMKHYKYQQTYMEIPIEGAGCIEHFSSENVLDFINAKVAVDIRANPKPKINPKEAVDLLLDILKKKNKRCKICLGVFRMERTSTV